MMNKEKRNNDFDAFILDCNLMMEGGCNAPLILFFCLNDTENHKK